MNEEGPMDVDVCVEGDALQDCRRGKPSASGMQRLVLCPGSWLAEKGFPDETSEAAEAGTRLHLHMEHGTLPEDAVEAEAVEWCRQMEQRLLGKYVAPMGADRVLREERWWDPDATFSGQADVVYIHEGCALVLDYKFGRVPVPVANSNMQLAALALLAFYNMPDVEVVFCGVLQPLASRQEPRVVRYQRDVIMDQLEGYFASVIAESERPNAKRVPGEVQCRYCKAKAECAACMALLSAVAGNDSLSDSGVTTALRSSGQSVAELWSDWAPEKKAEAVRLAGLAKKWAEAVERKAKADLKNGLSIPGCSLSAGKRCFKVDDAQGAFAVLARELGISGEEFAGCCSVKISELDKVVHKRRCERAGGGTKVLVKESAAWLREQLAGVGKESVSEPSLKVD